MRLGHLIGVILTLAIISSCTTSKPLVSSPTPTPTNMPLASGNTWVYSKTIYTQAKMPSFIASSLLKMGAYSQQLAEAFYLNQGITRRLTR